MDEAYLLHRERGAERGHHVGDAELVQGDHINVALNQDAFAAAGYFRLGKPYAQQLATFDVNLCLGGIYVFGGIVCVEGTAAESEHPSADGVDGEHHPFTEFVHHRAVFPLHGKAGGNQVFQLVTGFFCGIYEGSAAGRGPAEAEAADGVVFQAAAAQICIAHRAALGGGELLGKVFLGELAYQQKALTALPEGDFFCCLFFLNDVYLVL